MRTHIISERWTQFSTIAPERPAAVGLTSFEGADPEEPHSFENTVAEDVPAAARWTGVLGVEDELTGDGRLINSGSLRWENLPIPLRYVKNDVGMHDGAVIVGMADTVSRSGTLIMGEGPLDLGSDEGREAYRQIKEEYMTGVSMDLDDVSFEIRIAGDLWDDLMGGEDPEDPSNEEGEDEGEGEDRDSDGRVKVAEINSDDEVRVITDGRIRAATLVAIPAFDRARIGLADAPDDKDSDSDGDSDTDKDKDTDTNSNTNSEAAATIRDDEFTQLLASGALRNDPPKSWFADPRLSEPTALTITDKGRVFGHLALWGTCHTSYAMDGQCMPPPSSSSNYAHFRLGSTLTAEGAEIATGTIVLDTQHAANNVNAAAATAHYDNTGSSAANVSVGEDAHGIWVAGVLSESADEKVIRKFRAAPLSGDWRRIGGTLELVGILAVNVPGFPVPRPSGLVAAGAVQSLVASGMVAPRRIRRPGSEGSLSREDIRYLKRLANREREEESQSRSDAVTDLARRVRSSRAEVKVRRFAQLRKDKH